jgi:hypothetical protein
MIGPGHDMVLSFQRFFRYRREILGDVILGGESPVGGVGKSKTTAETPSGHMREILFRVK